MGKRRHRRPLRPPRLAAGRRTSLRRPIVESSSCPRQLQQQAANLRLLKRELHATPPVQLDLPCLLLCTALFGSQRRLFWLWLRKTHGAHHCLVGKLLLASHLLVSTNLSFLPFLDANTISSDLSTI
ncbi:hypothetical protein KC363_g189 [Hortaea werneckii]|nr:hypothetical protein KC363_g189 [Hortaea werneckii]